MHSQQKDGVSVSVRLCTIIRRDLEVINLTSLN